MYELHTKTDAWAFFLDFLTPFLGEEHVWRESLFGCVRVLFLGDLFLLYAESPVKSDSQLENRRINGKKGQRRVITRRGYSG